MAVGSAMTVSTRALRFPETGWMPRPLYGHATASRDEAGIRPSGSGPSFSAFALPGVDVPEFSKAGTVLELES